MLHIKQKRHYCSRKFNNVKPGFSHDFCRQEVDNNRANCFDMDNESFNLFQFWNSAQFP